MSIDKILTAFLGGIGIITVYWFFLMKKEKEVEVSGEIDVVVEGGYNPEVISIPKSKTTMINFIRKDSSSCLEEVLIPDFKIRKTLPLNEKVTVEVKPEKSGQYQISCGMNMFHGKLVVR